MNFTAEGAENRGGSAYEQCKAYREFQFLIVIPAKAGTHAATRAGGDLGSRLRGNDDVKILI
jgi:hypothetical protein